MSVLAGNLVRVRATFKNENGVKVDPATVQVSVKKPDLTITTYIYGTNPEVIKESVGVYYIDINTTNAVGNWFFVWKSSGTYQAIGQTTFEVVSAYFTPP